MAETKEFITGSDPSLEMVEETIGRLRELSQVSPQAIVVGTEKQEHPDLLAALVDDLCSALADAEREAAKLVAAIAKGPPPLAFARTSSQTRRSTTHSIRLSWSQNLHGRVDRALLLATLWSAAADVATVLVQADNALACC